jgi:hypothetical protein
MHDREIARALRLSAVSVVYRRLFANSDFHPHISVLPLTSKNFSCSFPIDAFPRADGYDFDAPSGEPIDDSSSSDAQTPISLKFLFECFSTSGIVEDVCQSGADLAF